MRVKVFTPRCRPYEMNNNNYSEEENSSAVVRAVLTSRGAGKPQITTPANLFVVGSAEGEVVEEG